MWVLNIHFANLLIDWLYRFWCYLSWIAIDRVWKCLFFFSYSFFFSFYGVCIDHFFWADLMDLVNVNVYARAHTFSTHQSTNNKLLQKFPLNTEFDRGALLLTGQFTNDTQKPNENKKKQRTVKSENSSFLFPFISIFIYSYLFHFPIPIFWTTGIYIKLYWENLFCHNIFNFFLSVFFLCEIILFSNFFFPHYSLCLFLVSFLFLLPRLNNNWRQNKPQTSRNDRSN